MTNITPILPRRFQMWAYTVGHGQLLLRSPKTTGFSTRIDILFKNVAAIHLPTTMEGLTVAEATDTEKPGLNIQVESSKMQGRKVYVIRGSGYDGYIVAGIVELHEDGGEYDEPSHFKLSTPADK